MYTELGTPKIVPETKKLVPFVAKGQIEAKKSGAGYLF